MQQVLTAPAAKDQSKNSRFAVWRVFWTHSNQPSGWPEWVALFACAALIAFAIPYHEPWADEAQAWQLARSLSLPTLFHTYIRYEGSPGLWHFLLWILVRMHVSYSGLHWICGAIAVVASSLLIFKSPFPRYLRLSLPFTFFLLFEYAVVARSYVLVPLLLYLIAICWKKRPLLIAVLLGLLANVALHASVISGGLAIVYCIEQIRSGTLKNPDARRKLLSSAVVVVGFCAFAIWTAWPAHDMHNVVAWMRYGHLRAFLAWAIVSITWAMCEPWFLSVLFWIAIALCFKARRCLLYLLPVLFFLTFSGAINITFHLAGLLVPLVISLLWMTSPRGKSRSSRYEIAGHAALLLLVVVQILWSAHAIIFDHNHQFSPDRATARYLRPFVKEGATIAVTSINKPGLGAYQSVGLLPYFDRNIYVNQTHAFWWWSDINQTDEQFPTTLRSRPAIVIVECAWTTRNSCLPLDLSQPRMKLLTDAGYTLTNTFSGAQPIRLGIGVRSCHLIFQRSAAMSAGLGRDAQKNPPDAAKLQTK